MKSKREIMEKKKKLKGRKERIIEDLDLEGKENMAEIGGSSKKGDGKREEGMDRIWCNKNRGSVLEVGQKRGNIERWKRKS